MKKREWKDILYGQVGRIGKAVSSPKRLELLDLLAQGEKTVEELAAELAADVKLISAHLKELRTARLVAGRREGRHVVYRLSEADVAHLLVILRQVAEAHLLELGRALEMMLAHPQELSPVGRRALLQRVRRGEVILLDVRPAAEYAAAHLPHARSLPVAELEQRLSELPKNREIVAYCRGPFCLFSQEAMAWLSQRGYRARVIRDGVAEWRAAGLPVETSAAAPKRTRRARSLSLST